MIELTPEERIARYKAISQHILNVAFPLGLWFVVEYFFTILSTQNIYLAAMRTPMMGIMPVALFYILYKIRKQYFADSKFSRRRCWFYSIQIMFYAGLIEAFVIAVYNQWIAPDNLAEMHRAMIAQYESVSNMYTQTPGAQQLFPNLANTMNETVNLLKEAEVESPLTAGINMLSNDIFYGIVWGFIFCFILRRNPKNNQETIENKEK